MVDSNWCQKYNVEIQGFPLEVNDGEDLKNTAVRVFNNEQMNVGCQPNDIEVIHRLPAAFRGSKTTIVRFPSRTTVDKINKGESKILLRI